MSLINSKSNIPRHPNFSQYIYNDIVDLPDDLIVHDFSQSEYSSSTNKSGFSIGKYNEVRLNMYKGELFTADKRNIHVGIDIGAPVGTKIKSFFNGEIFLFGYNDKPFDYGYTLITKHIIDSQEIYALYGHLSKESIKNKKKNKPIKSGEVIAEIGNKEENGGWPPHVHFQLSLVKPQTFDLPGVVSENERKIALKIFPDPRNVLGSIY